MECAESRGLVSDGSFPEMLAKQVPLFGPPKAVRNGGFDCNCVSVLTATPSLVSIFLFQTSTHTFVRENNSLPRGGDRFVQRIAQSNR